MSEYYEREIERLHNDLAVIYRRGRLTPTEKVSVDGLWARIERLETARVALLVRESVSEGVV